MIRVCLLKWRPMRGERVGELHGWRRHDRRSSAPGRYPLGPGPRGVEDTALRSRSRLQEAANGWLPVMLWVAAKHLQETFH